jgi:asparagine synthase (glutamine-hydrolysing)
VCGIAAIFNYRTGEPIDRGELNRIRDAMTPRGPEDAGDWLSSDGRIGLAHRRLSIIDLSPTGAQPMRNAEGTLLITFNGEIYNYRELRSDLEARGARFHGTSDTEVLVHLYEAEGQAMVNKLRGMYAFVLWDVRKRGLFLARDPFGIKPLYYSDDGRTLRAASQVKALLAGGHIDTAPEPAGHVGFFLWGHVPGPYTLYRGIKGLPAGATLWVDETGNKRERTFCSIPAILAEAEHSAQLSPLPAAHSPLPAPGSRLPAAHSPLPAPGSPLPAPRSPLHALRPSLLDSVRHHLIADVPVGVFLSSGLDSTTVAALAAEHGSSLRTVTLGFEEFKRTANDETALAETVARQLGAVHQTIWVTRHDFQEHRRRLFASMDQPSTDGVNTYFVSLAAARTSLKVALSGLGGDELFGGYPSFREIPRAVRSLNPFAASAMQPFNRAFRAVSAPLLKRFTSPKYAGIFEYGGSYSGAYLLRRSLFMPWELPALLDPQLVRQGWDDLQPLLRLEESMAGLTNPRLKVSCLEICWYMRSQLLRDSDWAGMAHSLEIRVPLVDIQLLRDLAPVLAGQNPPTKRQMAEAAFSRPNSSPLSPLLSAVLDRPKTGFSIPVREWLSQGLQDHGTTDHGTTDHGTTDHGTTDHGTPLSSLPSSLSYQRGLRGWARVVYTQFPGACLRAPRSRPRPVVPWSRGPVVPWSRRAVVPPRRILVLLTDAFGGHGGIAKFNRDLLSALCSAPDIGKVTALARLMPEQAAGLPPNLEWRTDGLGGKLRYAQAVVRETLRSRKSRAFPDLILCGHINLLPLAFLARRLMPRGPSGPDIPIALFIHGIDAWQPTRSRLNNRLAGKVQTVVAVSELTRNRFIHWSRLPASRAFVLPNSVDLSKFQPGPKPPRLLKRYRLENRAVLLTLGRLASPERQKGFDEVLAVLPDLTRQFPSLAYLVVGEGDDRPRLVAKARSLGLTVLEAGNGHPPPPPPPPPTGGGW